MILNGRIITTAVMLAIFAGMTVMALGYPEKARFLPLFISIPATLMCLAQLFFDVRSEFHSRAADGPAETTPEHRREIKMFAWLAFFFVGIMGFGFFVAAPILVFAYLRFGEKEPWTIAIAGGLGAWLILYGIFSQGLELYIFDGFVTPLLISRMFGG